MIGRLEIWLPLTIEDIKFRIREIIRRYIRKLIEIAITDLDLMGSFHDIASSAAFERKYLSQAAHFKGRSQLFRYALGQVGNDSGLFLEFGVYKGIRSIGSRRSDPARAGMALIPSLACRRLGRLELGQARSASGGSFQRSAIMSHSLRDFSKRRWRHSPPSIVDRRSLPAR